MFLPSRRPSRIACCAVGGASPPVVRSGTAAMSPAAHASGTPTTRRWSSTTIRPRSSTGSPPSPASGEGFTPAVQTSVSASNACPSDNRIVPPSVESRRMSNRTSIWRRSSWTCAYAARSSGSSGRIRPAASTRTHRMSRGSQRRVVPHRVASQVLELAQRLHPGVSGADEHERERRAPPLRVLGLGRDVQPGEHVVAEVDRLLHRLEPDPVLRQAGDRQDPRPRARRHTSTS